MSLLDRAFIKAYTKESPAVYQPDPPEPGLPPGAYIEVPESPEATSDALSSPPGEVYQRIDAAHPSAAPGPHFGQRKKKKKGTASAAACHRVPSPPGPGQRPLDAGEPSAFVADWEVDRFAWPKICTRLLGSQPAYFQAMARQLKANAGVDRQVLMIGGCCRGEGRTTFALCLARSAAEAGVSVGLVDADVGNPQLASRLGIDPAYGWRDVLAGRAPLGEAAVRSLEEPVTLFPLTQPGESENRPGEPQFLQLIRAISVHFPLVIVDTGPLGTVEEAAGTSGQEPPGISAIVVRDVRHTPEYEVQRQSRRLGERGIVAIGIVENFHSA